MTKLEKLEWLRAQTEAYLADAEATDNDREALRLFLLAVRCQEQIIDLGVGQPSATIH